MTIRRIISASAIAILFAAIVLWRGASREVETPPAAVPPQPPAVEPSQARAVVESGASTHTNATSRVDLKPSATATQAQQVVADLAKKANPATSDWPTESLSEISQTCLNRFQVLIESEAPPVEAAFLQLATGDCQISLPPQANIRPVYENARIKVLRLQPPTAEDPTAIQNQPATLAEWINQLRNLGSNRHVKLKTTAVTQSGNEFTTVVRYEANSREPFQREMAQQQPSQGRQVTAQYRVVWTLPNEDRRVLMKRAETLAYEVVTLQARGGRLFEDCTASALPAEDRRVQMGIPHWADRIPREFLGQFGHHGVAVGDVNGDGLDDLYVCQPGGVPNQLYVHQPDGTVRDQAASAGVDYLDDSVGALLIDLDNDGDQDLVVGVDPALQIAENDGTGKFQLQAALEVNTDAFSLSAADYDQDGDLDLYVCGYNVRKRDPTDRGLPFPMPYHDANNGGQNRLLQNQGGLRFIDVTEATGLNRNNSRFSMAAAWEDYDNDGDLDLYVANDFGRNNLYRNDDGKFTDVAANLGVEDQASGMSVSWGDANRDGLLDLYVGNMFSAAGNRVTFQRRFSAGKRQATVARMQRMARGNTLFINRTAKTESPEQDDLTDNAPVKFEDQSELAAVTMGRWAWSSRFVDITNSGWLDLVVANGYVTNEQTSDL